MPSPTNAPLAERFFEAISRGDTGAVADLYGPNTAIWHNYDDVEQTPSESLRLLGWLHREVGPLRYLEIRRIDLADGFIQQHVVELGTTGLRMPTMLRVYCDEERISRIEEYVDPTPLNAYLAARTVG